MGVGVGVSLSSILRETSWFYHKYSTLTCVSHYVSQRRQANKIKVVIFNLYQPRESRTEERVGSRYPQGPKKTNSLNCRSQHFVPNDRK